uniref:HAT C-terminal dimerisation domain-containing protein n=1 Tax=Amphiprion ocellaris TaxID=80972 RepID=A0A3Q1CR85_AMPOC
LSQKRKIDTENRRFNPAWTDIFVFTLPERLNAKPLCLICHESLSVIKEYNLRRHYTEKLQSFGAQFPEGTPERASKVQSLLAKYHRSSSSIVRACTAQERATLASLRVVDLTRKKRPFTDSETVKDCMLAVINEVINDEKMKVTITSAIKSIPLSDTSNIRRVEILATEVFDSLLKDLKKTPVMSIAVDESTDMSDTAQLCVYVRFFDSDRACFREELLCLLPLKGHTTGEIFFDKISAFFQANGLDVARVCMLVTDAASSMAGRVNGLAARWAAVAPRVTTLHCIVHQTVLCAKLSGHFKTVMDNVMATINFIGATSSLQHRLFRQLWLSKGNSLERFCELVEEIKIFLRQSKQKKAEAHLDRVMDCSFMMDVCFLADLFKHLNNLNLGLQGRDKTVTDLVEQTRAFQVKLNMFAADLSAGRMLAKEVVSSIDEGQFLLELVDMQSSLTMPQELCANGPAAFWSHVNVHQFPNLKKLAVTVLSMFASTYVCESSFSHMNTIKTNLRCSLHDSTLHNCLRIALTTYDIYVLLMRLLTTCLQRPSADSVFVQPAS